MTSSIPPTMPLRNISLFRALARTMQAYSESEPPSPELTRELGDLRKICLNLLMAFLTVHAVSASNVLGAMTLSLIVYTITLQLAITNSLLHDNPALTRFLHVVPLLGIFCMAIVELALAVKSPMLAAGVLLVCALPPIAIGIHYARWYAEVLSMELPVQGREVDLPVSRPTNTVGVLS